MSSPARLLAMVEHVQTSGARLALERLSDGPPAVALHAGVTDRRSWAPLARALDGRLGIVAYDRRGFGDTTYEPAPHRPLDDLLAVLPAEPAWVLGASMGGRLALELVAAHPERVAGLVLIAPSLGGEEDEVALAPHEQAVGDAIDAAFGAGDLDAVNRLECRLWLDGPTAREGRVRGAPRSLFNDMNGRALRAADPGEAEHGALPDPEALEVPTLVVVGDLDLEHVIAHATGLARTAPGARLARVPGTAHLPHLERPGQVGAAIGVFLDAVTGAG